MSVQGFDCAWLDHPFWRNKFVIQNNRDLERVIESGVAAVFIDDRDGVVPSKPEARVPPRKRPLPAQSAISAWRPEPDPIPDKQQALATGYARAARLMGRSRRAVATMFTEVRLGKAIKADKLVPLVDEITASIDANPRAFISIAQLKNRHEYTYMHSVAVCALMINLARELRFNEAAVREAGMAGLLHDVGKAVMPVEILEKPGALEDHEYSVMKTHPERGYELLSRSNGVPHSASDVCLRHHEKYDGSGYPDGRMGEKLSLFARMSTICDVYDAVTSERAYKRPWTPIETIARMREWTGHFDPEMLEIFIRSVGIYPIGALVRLKSGRIAMVSGENPDDPTAPPLVGLAAPHSPEPQRILAGSDEIISMESAAALQIPDWEAERTRLVRRFGSSR